MKFGIVMDDECKAYIDGVRQSFSLLPTDLSREAFFVDLLEQFKPKPDVMSVLAFILMNSESCSYQNLGETPRDDLN